MLQDDEGSRRKTPALERRYASLFKSLPQDHSIFPKGLDASQACGDVAAHMPVTTAFGPVCPIAGEMSPT